MCEEYNGNQIVRILWKNELGQKTFCRYFIGVHTINSDFQEDWCFGSGSSRLKNISNVGLTESFGIRKYFTNRDVVAPEDELEALSVIWMLDLVHCQIAHISVRNMSLCLCDDDDACV